MFDLNFLLPTNYSNLGVVFLVGLVAGISTCGGLLSSFVLAISAKNQDSDSIVDFSSSIRPHLYFNIGRIFFFTLFGVLAGFLGKYLIISNFLIGLLVLISSFYLLILGIKLTKLTKFMDKVDLSFKILNKLAPKFVHFKEKSVSSKFGLFMLGGITFFLPCGFTQAIQLFTLTLADPVVSGLTLFVFALGTTPGLLALASATTLISAKKSAILFKFIGFIVIYFAIVNIVNSFNLIGINTNFNSSNFQFFSLNNGYQEVRIIQNHKGYEPNLITIKKDIPVKLIITSRNNSTCASYIVIEKFGIRKFLELGDNLIEFTPSETGDFQFSCGMGMHPGIIRVIN